MNPKLRELLERVYEKTRVGGLTWEEANADDAFEVQLGRGTLLIFHREASHANAAHYGVILFDDNSRVVERDTFPELPASQSEVEKELAAELPVSLSELLQSLYRVARSQARNGDQMIDELLHDLR